MLKKHTIYAIACATLISGGVIGAFAATPAKAVETPYAQATRCAAIYRVAAGLFPDGTDPKIGMAKFDAMWTEQAKMVQPANRRMDGDIDAQIAELKTKPEISGRDIPQSLTYLGAIGSDCEKLPVVVALPKNPQGKDIAYPDMLKCITHQQWSADQVRSGADAVWVTNHFRTRGALLKTIAREGYPEKAAALETDLTAERNKMNAAFAPSNKSAGLAKSIVGNECNDIAQNFQNDVVAKQLTAENRNDIDLSRRYLECAGILNWRGKTSDDQKLKKDFLVLEQRLIAAGKAAQPLVRDIVINSVVETFSFSAGMALLPNISDESAEKAKAAGNRCKATLEVI